MNFLNLLDLGIFLPLLGLTGISLSLIASTTSTLFLNQSAYFIIGLFLYIVFASADYKIWKKFRLYLYTGSLIFLLVSFLGASVRGSNRWIDIGFFRIQPSEMVKPFFMIYFADLLTSRKGSYLTSFIKHLLILFPVIFLIFRQPDLGNVLVYLFTFLVMEIAGGLPVLYIISGSLISGLLVPFIWKILKDYQKVRILSFLNPQNDPVGTGYNALQAIIAIGSGQFWGLGLGRGTQSHLLFLPEYHTDFVFASIGEELGFIGGALIIIFYFVMLIRLIYLSISVKDEFGKFICIGTFAQLFIQIFINIGMNLRLLPITGITLPFVSYGGSSVLSSFIALGLVVSIKRDPGKLSHPLVIK